MTKTIGYTAKQAERIKRSIDLDMAKIEDLAYGMRRRIGDISVGTAPVDLHLEELRLIADELKTIVDRRTA